MDQGPERDGPPGLSGPGPQSGYPPRFGQGRGFVGQPGLSHASFTREHDPGRPGPVEGLLDELELFVAPDQRPGDGHPGNTPSAPRASGRIVGPSVSANNLEADVS
jgi:hypothetical protein